MDEEHEEHEEQELVEVLQKVEENMQDAPPAGGKRVEWRGL